MIYSMIQTGVSANSATSVTIDMRDDDHIQSVQLIMWGVQAAAVLSVTPYESQLSFLSTPDFQTNDLNGLIVQAVAKYDMSNALVNDAGVYHFCQQIFVPDVAVQGGERIYLHTTGPAGVSFRVKTTIFTKKAGRQVARRLR